LEILRFMLAWAQQCRPPFDERLVREKCARAFKGVQSREMIELPLTDTGNAERMVLLSGDRFRWVLGGAAGGMFLAWDGRRWKPGSLETVKAIALDAARSLGLAAARLSGERDPARKKSVFTHAVRGESAKGIRDAVENVKILPDVQVERSRLDARPDLLNVENGISCGVRYLRFRHGTTG